MIKFNKPVNINGTQLLSELNAAGVTITDSPLIDGNGDFWLNILESDVLKAQPIVEAHNGVDSPEITVEQKLASVGLNIEDLKTALGL
jgi:hypothetical protein